MKADYSELLRQIKQRDSVIDCLLQELDARKTDTLVRDPYTQKIKIHHDITVPQKTLRYSDMYEDIGIATFFF